MNESKTPLLEIVDLRAGYGQKEVLKGITFQIGPGELTGLLGANGCGKTTLLRTLCKTLPFTGGCTLCGQRLETLRPRELSRLASYIPQRSGIRISLPVLEVVLMGFNPILGLMERPSALQEQKAFQALEAVGLEEAAELDYQTLSEGQKQLCILARALVADTPFLMLDEPESSLDFPHRHHMMRLLQKLVHGKGVQSDTSSRQKAALVTLHDPDLALRYCDQLILLGDGTCADILRPASDPIPRMEAAMSSLYGPVRLLATKEDGARRLVLLPLP